MRKLRLYIVFFLFVLLGTTSCTTYYCECKTRLGIIVDVTPIKSLGKIGAKSVCDSYQEQNNRNGADQVCSLR